MKRRKKVSEIDKDMIREYYGDSKYWRKRLLKNKNPRGTGHSTYKEIIKKRNKKMTQLYRIEKQDWDNSSAHQLISEWSTHNVCYAEMIKNENITQEEAVELSQYGPRNGCFQFAAIYRKNEHNYIWRGRRVPTVIRDRLIKMLISDDPAKQKEGTMLLYKTSGNSRVDNRLFYPVRLSNNRYTFQMGSLAGLQQFMNDNYNTDEKQDSFNVIFKMWAVEHLLDFDEVKFYGSRYRRRAMMAFLMDTLVTLDEYKELYHNTSSNEGLLRATHCVWKDGQITEWERCGQNIHPKI